MKSYDIIRMAQEANNIAPRDDFNQTAWVFGDDALERFAALVAAAEREALLLNDARYRFLRNGGWEVLQDTKYWAPENRFDGAIDAARLDVAIDAAIRARGNGGEK